MVFERKLSFGNRDSGPDMDETIWQSLPEDIEDKVLAWLPVTSCARFKSVCKRWLNLMDFERFLQMHSCNNPPETWVLSFRDQSLDSKLDFKYKGHVFDRVTNKTFMLEFPFLPENSVPVATAGGLVCFCCDSSSNGENKVSFYVCNPITKAWKFIPSPCSKVALVTLVADSEAGKFTGYKLYVFCEASVVRWLWVGVLDHTTMEYDSRLNHWKDVGDVHSGEQFKPGSVFSQGKVHLLSSETVEVLDVKQGTWFMMDAPSYASCATLLERRGRLLVVGDMVHHNVFHLPNIRSYVGIVIWEYDPSIRTWSEVTRMPETFVNNFSYSSFSCVIVDDLLYLFSRSCPHSMAYSFTHQLWSRVPNWCEETTFKVLSYTPRLDAFP